MKKILLICVLLLAIVLSFAACGDNDSPPINNEGSNNETPHTHSFGEWEVTVKPTCTNDGTKVRYCSCGEKQSYTIESIGHVYNEWFTVEEATCLKKGFKERVCSCGERERADIAATNHNFINYVCDNCGEISAESTPVELFVFIELEDGTYSVKGRIEDIDINNIPNVVVIPSEYSGKPVTKIENHAFFSYMPVEVFIIPDSVTSIGEGAFYFCTSLISIQIPNSVISIENYAFEDCYSLNSINMGNSVINIGKEAFRNCYSLKSITIPDSVTSIGERTFYQCYALKSITIGNSVINIGKEAFDSCYSLKSITIPVSVTTIGEMAFSNCILLKDICFTGSKEEWAQISITDYDKEIINHATIYYNYAPKE